MQRFATAEATVLKETTKPFLKHLHTIHYKFALFYREFIILSFAKIQYYGPLFIVYIYRSQVPVKIHLSEVLPLPQVDIHMYCSKRF